MKKILWSVCLICFLVASLPVYAARMEPIQGTAVIQVESLNVRSGPSKEADKLGTLAKDVSVEVIGIAETDWYVIEFEGKEGYIYSEYVFFTPIEEEQEEAAETGIQQEYIVMALVVAILIIGGIMVYTFLHIRMEEDEEEEENIPVSDHDNTNMHMGEVTYDTYRIDIDPRYFEKTTVIPQPESIWDEKEQVLDKKEKMKEEMADEFTVEEIVTAERDMKELDTRLEQASAQIAALQKEVEQLKKSQTGSII